MATKLCNGRLSVTEDTPERIRKTLDFPAFGFFGGGDNRPRGVKRKRLVCPKCKRRVLSSVSVCHDGCCLIHTLPPHKPKGWWKRKKKKRKERQTRRR